VKRFVNYGMPLMLWFLSAQLLRIGDRYVIQFFCGAEDVGVYSANYNLAASIAGFMSEPIMAAAFPIIMYMWADKRKEEVKKCLEKITELYVVLGFFSLGVIMVGGKVLLAKILGNNFRQGADVYLPVVAGIIICQAALIGQKSLELTENTRMMFVFSLISAVVNIVLNILTVPFFGYIAAAYTTLVSYLLYAAMIWKYSKKNFEWVVEIKKIAVYFGLFIFSLLLALQIERVSIEPEILRAFCCVVVFSFSFGVLLLFAKWNEIKSYKITGFTKNEP
jgi:O-antigen/teichoic acid export membrane protein